MENKSKPELLLETFHRLVSAILGQTANPETDLRDIMSDNIKGFGTGKHEIFNSYNEYREKIFKVFGKQLPAGAKLHFIDIQSEVLDAVGIVHATYEIIYIQDGIENNYYGRRSTVFQWSNDRWHAIHLHVSEPSAHLAAGESLPVKALKAQNEELKKQVAIRTEELSKSLNELRATQAQLIQREKLASLGELTAGIAHEIQNPLNFVNNFSDVNKELVDELKTELATGNMHSDGYRKANEIADIIKENEEKINHHGKRADAIVKGMLQHSRVSAGQKESTDINALADEYLRLSYHGFRAKDNSLSPEVSGRQAGVNAIPITIGLKTDFDESIGNVNIVPQDIGRVILNLLNNAFYAASLPSQGGFSDSDRNKNPTVWLSTRKVDGKVEIRVKDNGAGIPQNLLDKIFQPFFTTKPSGEGTGLGLSLSYDIIKAHGGDLKVETKEGEGSEFIVSFST
jgi:signal transduction histidine kinase